MSDPARPAPTESHKHQWQLVAACSAVALLGAAGYYTADGAAKGRIWEAVIISLLALMAFGIARFQRGSRLPWLAIWVGLTSAFLGGFLIAHPELAPFDVASPSPVDAMRLANYPLGAIGVLLLLFRQNHRIGTRALLEAAIATGAGSLAIWALAIEPLTTGADPGGATIVSYLYPLGDVLLLAVLMVLSTHLSHRPGSLLLVALALTGNLAADIAFSHQSLNGGYEPGGLVDVGWLLCFASLALAPSWPVITKPRPVGDDGRLNGGRLAFLSAGALLAPVVAFIQTQNGGQPDTAVLLATLGLFLLVLFRIVLFNLDLDESRAEEADTAKRLLESNHDLEQARSDQRHLIHRIHRVVEEERTRIAADLHDRPLQNLAGVGYQLERMSLLLERGDTAGASTVCHQAADHLATQLGDLRTLMTDIRPPVLDERGLLGALRDRAAELSQKHATLDLVVEGDTIRVDATVETALYRVAQEALQNVVRHANASLVCIVVIVQEETVVLSIADDGCGFAAQSSSRLLRTGRFGLAGMRERVELLGGTMTIDTGDLGGTTVEFRLPTVPPQTLPMPLLAGAK